MYVVVQTGTYNHEISGCFLSIKEAVKWAEIRSREAIDDAHNFNIVTCPFGRTERLVDSDYGGFESQIIASLLRRKGEFTWKIYREIKEEIDPIRDFLSAALSGDGQALDAIRDILKS